MNISETSLEIQREPFAKPFGFKGAAFHEKWNMVVRLRDSEERMAYGLGGLAVLWSDGRIFASHTEVGGNLLQASILEYALQLVKDREFAGPMDLLNEILSSVHAYAKQVTGLADLNLTFTLIALVALDNAVWMLQARQTDTTSFYALLPETYRCHLADRQSKLAAVPAIGYNMSSTEVTSLLDAGVYVLKVKIGQPGDEGEMVRADMDRLCKVHEIAERYETVGTESGQIAYYLDANGRYGSRDALERLLAYAGKRGILERIIVIEEPFNDPDSTDVLGLPALFAADESLGDVSDVAVRVNQGYRAITIKPAGKTLSKSLEMIESAIGNGAVPFVADNACVPILVEWNKNVAARLPSFPGLVGGMLESNGPENYGAWRQMISAYPVGNATWLNPEDGEYNLDASYYHHSGGIFRDPVPYSDLLR